MGCVWRARTSLSDGIFEIHLSFGEDGTEVASPYAGGVVRTLYGRDGLWRETFRRTGAEILLKTYDAAGDVVSETLTNSMTGAYAETVAAYDARHRAVSVGEGFRAAPTRFSSLSWDDRRGILNRIVSPKGRIREWTTNGSEIVVYGAGIADPRNISRIALDENERTSSMVDPDGGRADFTRNAGGYVTRVEETGLPPVEFGYDALGRVSSVSMPGPSGTMRTVSVANNWRGKPLSVTHADGRIRVRTY